MVLISAEDNRLIFGISLRSAVYQIRHFETTHWKSKAVYPELHLFYKGKVKTGMAKYRRSACPRTRRASPVREAYDQYAATTKDEAQCRYWIFYEGIKCGFKYCPV
jgi:hypothetical protein